MNAKNTMPRPCDWRDTAFILLIALLLILLYGCRSVRTEYVPFEVHTRDSIAMHDTVVVKLLVPYRDSTSVTDTASFLCNPYAYSYARWSGGLLHHSLGIWPQARFTFNFPLVTRYVKEEVEVPYPVERKLSRWEQTCLNYGGEAIVACSGFVLIAFGWLIYKITKP